MFEISRMYDLEIQEFISRALIAFPGAVGDSNQKLIPVWLQT